MALTSNCGAAPHHACRLSLLIIQPTMRYVLGGGQRRRAGNSCADASAGSIRRSGRLCAEAGLAGCRRQMSHFAGQARHGSRNVSDLLLAHGTRRWQKGKGAQPQGAWLVPRGVPTLSCRCGRLPPHLPGRNMR